MHIAGFDLWASKYNAKSIATTKVNISSIRPPPNTVTYNPSTTSVVST